MAGFLRRSRTEASLSGYLKRLKRLAAFLCGGGADGWGRGGCGGKRHCKINGLVGCENFVKKELAFLARMWDYMPCFAPLGA